MRDRLAGVTRIELIPPRRATGELKRAYRATADMWGGAGLPTVAVRIVQCFSTRPEYVEPIGLGYYYTGWCASTRRTVLESLAVLVSRFNECFY